MKKITAPFTPEQVAALNRFQTCGLVHPFTCGTPTCRMNLIATEAGWECPYCEYTQDWAHDFMADQKVLVAIEKGAVTWRFRQ